MNQIAKSDTQSANPLAPQVQRHHRWTSSEENQLLQVVKQYGTKNWKSIASFFLSRTASQCAQRYRRLITPSIRKAWTIEEDNYLKSNLQQSGKGRWAAVAKGLQGRTGKQVRERYLSILEPGVRKYKFSKKDDKKILKLVEQVGFRWKLIAASFGGRTENQIKNRFYSHILKKVVYKNQEKFPAIIAILNERHKKEEDQIQKDNIKESIITKKEDNQIESDNNNNLRSLIQIAPSIQLSPFQQLLQSTEKKLFDNFQKISILQVQLQQKAGEFIANASNIQRNLIHSNAGADWQSSLIKNCSTPVPNEKKVGLQIFTTIRPCQCFGNQEMSNEQQFNNNNFNN